MGKLSPRLIVVNHLKTLVRSDKGNSKKTDWIDVFFQFVIPAVAARAAYGLGLNWSGGSLTTVVSVVTTLMAAVAIFLFQIRIQFWEDRATLKKTLLDDDDVLLIDELFANVMWVILAGFVLAIISVASDLICQDSLSGRVLSAVCIALALNFGMVILMCLKRLSRAYDRIGRHLKK